MTIDPVVEIWRSTLEAEDAANQACVDFERLNSDPLTSEPTRKAALDRTDALYGVAGEIESGLCRVNATSLGGLLAQLRSLRRVFRDDELAARNCDITIAGIEAMANSNPPRLPDRQSWEAPPLTLDMALDQMRLLDRLLVAEKEAARREMVAFAEQHGRVYNGVPLDQDFAVQLCRRLIAGVGAMNEGAVL